MPEPGDVVITRVKFTNNNKTPRKWNCSNEDNIAKICGIKYDILAQGLNRVV